MKLFKKTAALLFCLALVFSVMAISASADEVQLLSVTTDSDITLSLVDTSSNTDINDVTGKEYTSNTSGTAAIQLAYTGSGTAPTVNAFEFTLGTGSGNATVTFDTTTPVAGSSDFSIQEVNGSNKYTFSTNGAAGVELTDTPVTVATINFTVSGNAGDTKAITVSDFKLFNTGIASGEATAPASDAASVSVEIDPQYTVTVKNPVYNTTNYTAISSYEVYAASANSYKILAGKGAAMTAPELDYFDFSGTYEVATGSAGSWASLIGNTKTTAQIEALLDGGESYGDVILNAVYTPHKYNITVEKPTPSTDNYTIDPENPNYTTGSAVAYQYDITGALFTSAGATGGAFAKVDVDYYDFLEYVAVASDNQNDGNWTASDKITPTRTASGRDFNYSFTNSVTVGKYGNVVLNATYTPHVYEITFKQPGVDNNGIISNSATKIPAPSGDTASMTYTVEGKVSAEANAGNASLPTSATKTAYTFNNAYVLETVSAGWANNTTTTFTGAIGAGKYGDVTLVAQFTATEYTVTYDLDGGAFSGTYNNVAAVVPKTATTSTYSAESDFKYTIADTDDTDGAFTFGVPVKAGYNFTGWTATHAENNTDHSDFPEASTSASYVGMYGNVTLTANWAIEGKFVAVDYWYARQDADNNVADMLILFAVPSDNVPKNNSNAQVGAYKFGNNAMFKTTKYASAFTGNNALSGDYTIFAYIGSGTGLAGTSFSYDAAATANTSISYEGDVTGDGAKDPADYGNVVAMLAGRTYTNTALTVEARLKADMNDTNTDANRYFGTIEDVRAIMNKVLGKS